MEQHNWGRAIAVATAAYDGLPRDRRDELKRLVTEIMKLKQSLVGIVTAAGSSDTCRTCNGECCLLGRYHVSILDILAYHIAGVAPVTPDFNRHPACPYSDESGCRMSPGYRPLACVVFNCHAIEELLTTAELETFSRLEAELRTAVATAVRIYGARVDRPLLLSLH